MKTKIIGYYSIFLAIAITGYWIMTISSVSYPEGKIEIAFHVFSEILMAFICLLSGIFLLKKKKHARNLSIIGFSMILYSVLNAAGYFGERNELSLTIMFMALFLLTSIALIIQLEFKT
jgi:hypothetical protein